MRLAAIFNVWGDHELLQHSIKKIRPLVDGVIVVWSHFSNYFEEEHMMDFDEENTYVQKEPVRGLAVIDNETAKRNAGLQKAREMGYTHFLMMDADEFYDPKEFLKEKERFENSDIIGLVCRTKVYFRHPTLTIGYDTTLVPFIHKITPDLKFCFNKKYPFAWSSADGIPSTITKQIRIDPTRSMNIDMKPDRGDGDGVIMDRSGVAWSDITMHHFSWVRKDIQKKIRNSTARTNIERSSILTDYCQSKEGYFCEFYGKTLVSCPNAFGVPDLNDSKSLQLCKEPSKASDPDSPNQQRR